MKDNETMEYFEKKYDNKQEVTNVSEDNAEIAKINNEIAENTNAGKSNGGMSTAKKIAIGILASTMVIGGSIGAYFVSRNTNTPTNPTTTAPISSTTEEPSITPTNPIQTEPIGEVTDEPSTEPSTTRPAEPTTDEPWGEVTEEPTTKAPVIERPTEPTTDEPWGEVTEEPTTKAPVIERPTEPTTEEPWGQVTEEPTTEEPTTERPTEPPTTEEPWGEVTEEPTRDINDQGHPGHGSGDIDEPDFGEW